MDRFEISDLRGYYGALLTERQNEMLRLHYDEDISYGELAEIFGVSRQAALDSIKRGERALAEFEEKLGALGRESRLGEALSRALKAIESENYGEAESAAKAAKAILEE